ncbi:MAG: GIY-YIG nuclease family protein [Candidatus Omnitrophota bacterium]|jgi:putative endonuclease
MWYIYILKCKGGTLYTGMTNDLERRFKEHLSGKSRYTSYNRPVCLVYKEEHPTRSAAAKREAEIKNWARGKKLALIKSGIMTARRQG